MRKLILFLSLILSISFASAQSEVPSDSIKHTTPSKMKDFGGFLLDMGLMSVSTPKLPKYDLAPSNISKDYNQLFSLNTNSIYTQGVTNLFSGSSFSGLGSSYDLGMSYSPQIMQMSTFKLKNGWRISTYGDYNKEGWRVPNQSALPWEKNNFRGAFELKSGNGNFGIRIEVQQGRNSLY